MKRATRGPAERERRTGDCSVPDTLLPGQYFDGVAARVSAVPEKRLMAAVLFDAVIHLRRRGSTGALEAERWIRGLDETAEPLFSFRNVCESLGMDPTYLANGLLRFAADAEAVRRLPLRQPRSSRPRILPFRRRRRAHVA